MDNMEEALSSFSHTNPSGFASIKILDIQRRLGGTTRDIAVRYRKRYPRSGIEYGQIFEVERKLTRSDTFRLEGWRVSVHKSFTQRPEDGGYDVTYRAEIMEPMNKKAAFNERFDLVETKYYNESGERRVYSSAFRKYVNESEKIAADDRQSADASDTFTSVGIDPLGALPQSENTGSTGGADEDVISAMNGDGSYKPILMAAQSIAADGDLGYDGALDASGRPLPADGTASTGEGGSRPQNGSEGSEDGDDGWAIPYVDDRQAPGDPDEEFDGAENAENGQGEKEDEWAGEVRHEEYDTIKACMWAGIPVYLSGPAGSGKNYTVEQICRDMEWDFYFSNSIQQEYKITGFIDAGGTYHETEFYKACTSERECAFFIDEMDNSIPEVLVLLNAAIANGYFEFPVGRVSIKNVHFVAAGNTTGSGADELYTGRMVLDQASLDRFAQIQFGYSFKIEMKLSHGNEELVRFIRALRSFAEERGIRATFSYRCIDMVTRLEAQELPMIDILKVAVFKGLDADTVGTFRDAVMGIGYGRYFRAATTICSAPSNYFTSGRY